MLAKGREAGLGERRSYDCLALAKTIAKRQPQAGQHVIRIVTEMELSTSCSPILSRQGTHDSKVCHGIVEKNGASTSFYLPQELLDSCQSKAALIERTMDSLLQSHTYGPGIL